MTKNLHKQSSGLLLLAMVLLVSCSSLTKNQKAVSTTKEQELQTINLVNDYWQNNNSANVRSFWDHAAYHTGNMEVYKLTQNETYRKY